MIDRSFRDDESSIVNNRTVQDNLSENSLGGGRSDRDKPLTLNAQSEAGENFNTKFGGEPSNSELDQGSIEGDKKVFKAVRDEEEAKKALERLRAKLDLEE